MKIAVVGATGATGRRVEHGPYAHLCLIEGFTVHSSSETLLCTNCARMHRFQQTRVSFERKAESPGCCMP
jgi:hypothetical protein